MSSKQKPRIDEQQLSDFFIEVTEKVKCEEDPVILTEYKKIFKKSVPLHLRNYVAAYLATRMLEPSRNYYSEGSRNHSKKRDFGIRSKASHVDIPEDQAATIFISVGKNRKAFKKDFAGMIANECNLDHDRIGAIKVLENYSFITLYKEDADAVIEKLNGYEFRGRKLNVSYSRKRPNSYSENEASSEENDEKIPDSNETLE